jgi:hypothetical protein
MERLALLEVRKRFPELRRGRFDAIVRETCGTEFPPNGLGIIPDGWFVDGDYIHGEDRGEPATFTCIEIENTHYLSPEKLWRYCVAYDLLDGCGHYLRLFVFDRYGMNERELKLCELFRALFFEKYGYAPTDAADALDAYALMLARRP